MGTKLPLSSCLNKRIDIKKTTLAPACLLLLCVVIGGASCLRSGGKADAWDNSRLEMQKLSYRGLPLITSKETLSETLGLPAEISEMKSIQPKPGGGFGAEVTSQLYTYRVGAGFLSFSVYEHQALIYEVGFFDPQIELVYAHGGIRLSNQLTFARGTALFSAGVGEERDSKVSRKMLIFESNARSGMPAYATPILKFENGYLATLYYYPEFATLVPQAEN